MPHSGSHERGGTVLLTGTLHTWGIVGFTVFGIPVVGLSVLSGCVDGVVVFGAVTH